MSGLRILNDPDVTRFELAGSLSGVDVETVYQAWQREAVDPLRTVVVEMTSVTEVDEHGRALLLIMHRFGAHIIAKSPESFAIAPPIVAQLDRPVVRNTGWIGRLANFLGEHRHTKTFPPQAEMILHMPSGQRLSA